MNSSTSHTQRNEITYLEARPQSGRRLSDTQFAILLILPALALFALVILYPLVNSMYIGLLDKSLVTPGEEFVGLTLA